MEESISKILELAISQGIWAALYIYLFFRMLKENKAREDRYQATETRMGEDIEAAESMCRDLMESGAEILESRRSEAQDDALLLKAAQSFFDAIVSYVCNHICQKTSYSENECPIAKYLDYMRWLEDELDACRRKS